MGLLDELKQQADALRLEQQASQEERNQSLLRAHAKLKDALHYWIELFSSLNVIKPAIPRNYYLDSGAAGFDNLMQCDYNVNGRRLTQDHRDYIDAMVLRFRCAADRKVTIEKQGDRLVQQLREYLWMNNLRFDLKEIRNERGYVERGIFTLNCDVPVMINIAADLENSRIKIITTNFASLGEYEYVYDYDEFGNAILEELAKAILGKPNAFRTLGRHQQAMHATPSRMARQEPDDSAPPQPLQTETAPDHAGAPAKGFVGNLKSILKH